MTIHKRLPGANAPDPPAARLDRTDPVAFEAWLHTLNERILDVVAIGEDAVKPRKKRMFTRHEAARQLVAGERSILRHLAAAAVAPPAPDPPSRE